MRCHYFPFLAGVNMGGDLDHIGRPVVEGLHYVAAQKEPAHEDPGDHASLCVAGPFADYWTASAVAKTLRDLDVPAPDHVEPLPGHNRARYHFGDAEEAKEWARARFPNLTGPLSPAGLYRAAGRRTVTIAGATVTVYKRDPGTKVGA